MKQSHVRPTSSLALMILVLLSACASSSTPPAQHAEVGHAAVRVVTEPAFAAILKSEGFAGTIAVLGPDGADVRCSSATDCETPSVPASTFKIVNSIIALETGVAPDATLVIPWDGTDHGVAAWNHDLDMRGAFSASSVPYYQELARRIGIDRMREWVSRLEYGNRQTGNEVDTFWLRGPLAISPVEQLTFLRRFESGTLPISERTRSIVRELMFREQRGDATFRGKTGWGSPGAPDERGWFVGYATRGTQSTFVAVRLHRPSSIPDDRFLEARPRIARRVLEELGAY